VSNIELLREIIKRFDTLTLQGMRNWEQAMAMEQLMLQLMQNLQNTEGAINAENQTGE